MNTFLIRSKESGEVFSDFRWHWGSCSKAKLEPGCSKCSKRTFVMSSPGLKITACKFYFKKVKKIEEILDKL